jgi:energy-coupling factor transporter ATP-binding protein EcfA2
VERFAAANWRGAIIGPHGSGKSTLLETLRPALVAAGHSISSIALRDRQRRLPRSFIDRTKASPVTHSGEECFIVIVDGYEQLLWLERLKLIRECRRRQLGLLVTSHAATCLPTLIRLTPNRQLIEQLVRELCDQVSTHVAAEEVVASHACHGSNVREILFDLYDRYERRRRNP